MGTKQIDAPTCDCGAAMVQVSGHIGHYTKSCACDDERDLDESDTAWREDFHSDG